jgi:hypothetical protein
MIIEIIAACFATAAAAEVARVATHKIGYKVAEDKYSDDQEKLEKAKNTVDIASAGAGVVAAGATAAASACIINNNNSDTADTPEEE